MGIKKGNIALNAIGLLGGTFDPVHFGHLRAALECQHELQLQEIRFIPCRQPVLKKAAFAEAEQRLAMLNIAIAHQPEWRVDTRELYRKTPSYMVETLLSLRTDYPPEQSLCLIIGSDILDELPRWHRWQEILTLCHLIVVHRHQTTPTLSDMMSDFVARHPLSSATALQQSPAGGIFFQEITLLDISSTQIRHTIAHDISARYLVPDGVWDYIQEQKLYRG